MTDAPVRVVADPRKFSEYVLVPSHPSGKDRIFLGTLGYRPRNEEDAEELAKTYVAQAEARMVAGDFVVGSSDRFGQRYVIEIELNGVWVRSIWILRSDGTLALVTPFSGFSRPTP